MKDVWRPMTAAELAEKGKRVAGAHALNGRICHWPYCTRCGLVALKNDVSRRALRQPCVTFE